MSPLGIKVIFLHFFFLDFVVPHLCFPLRSLIFSNLYIFHLPESLILRTPPASYILSHPQSLHDFLKRMLNCGYTPHIVFNNMHARHLMITNYLLYVTLFSIFLYLTSLKLLQYLMNVTVMLSFINVRHITEYSIQTYIAQYITNCFYASLIYSHTFYISHRLVLII